MHGEGPNLFLKALQQFVERARHIDIVPGEGPVSALISQQRVVETDATKEAAQPPIEENSLSYVHHLEQDSALARETSSVQEQIHGLIETGTELVFFTDDTVEDASPILSMDQEFPLLPRKTLSPYAPIFVPSALNFLPDLVSCSLGHAPSPVEEDDIFSNFPNKSLVHNLNAVEDYAKERDGPILYTHSDGEDFVFIDSNLKPLHIDLSRCSKHPLHLRKELKGRRTFSPSQIVTRSKTKLLEEGRRSTPIGWEEEDDMMNHDEEILNFFKLCCPHKRETPKPASKLLTKSQKKKMKKKKKKSPISDYGYEDDIEYAY